MKSKKHLILVSAGVIATSLLVTPVAQASTYIVQKGDTLTKIAKENNTTVNHLKTWNSLNNDLIYIGQKIAVTKSATAMKPAAKILVAVNKEKQQTTPVSSKVAANTVQKIANTSSYKVAKGDTLTKIASKYSVNIADLMNWNNLKADTIYIGQTLKIQAENQQDKSAKPEQSENSASDQLVVAEPILVFPEKEKINADESIKKQLLNERAIPFNPNKTGQVLYEEAVALALSLENVPYVYGGNTPDGFDCSGFVRYVYANAGLDLTRKSSEDYFMSDTTIVENPVPGDIVFFKNTYKSGISHMGIYLGDGTFIHAGNNGVELSNINYSYWKDRFVAFKRFKGI